mgnify:CR=1 FL=1
MSANTLTVRPQGLGEEIANAVSVAVLKASGIDLINHSFLPPFFFRAIHLCLLIYNDYLCTKYIIHT